MGGCVGKKDFTKGVSEEDKKLLSANYEKILYIYKNRLRVTRTGFYPNYNDGYYPDKNVLIPDGPSSEKKFRTNYYSSKISNYFGLRQFNLKKFVDDINNNNLRNIHEKIIIVKKKKYPYIKDINLLMPEDIIALASDNISEKKKKIIEKKYHVAAKEYDARQEEYRAEVCKRDERFFIKGECYNTPYIPYIPYRPPSKSYDKPSYDSRSSGSGSGYSGSSSGCRVQTVYVPGGNGRTAQTTVCN